MQVTAEQTNPSTIVLEIQVDEQEVARAFDTVYREFSRYVNIPGFRPGKAPRAIVERYVSADKVRERTQEKLIRDSYPKALEENGITPYGNPDFDPADLEDKQPYKYKATIPLEPKVTLGPYTGLTVEKPIFPVNDEAVENRLQQMREERARLERIADRGVEAGDVLIAENKVVLDGEDDTADLRRQLVQVGNNIPGFDDAIIGMMPDETRVFELTYPDDYDEEDRRGKHATFTVRLSSISAKKLPELDDEFAQAAGGVETVDALRASVRASLEAQATRLSEQVAEQNLIHQIHDASEISYPEALVRSEMEGDLRHFGAELRRANLTYDQYLQQSGRTSEDVQTELARRVEYRVRTMLMLGEIAKQEQIVVTDADIDAEFDRLETIGQITIEQADEYRADRNRRGQVANAAVVKRISEFLFAHNTVQEVEQTAPADPEALAEANAESEPE